MKWEKAPEELVSFLSETMKDIDCQYKKMFGYPAYFINSNMFIGAHQRNLFIRLSEEDRKKIMSQYNEVSPFVPMVGHVMHEYVVIPETLYRDTERFAGILNMSIEYVSSLPPKGKGKSRKKKRT